MLSYMWLSLRIRLPIIASTTLSSSELGQVSYGWIMGPDALHHLTRKRQTTLHSNIRTYTHTL